MKKYKAMRMDLELVKDDIDASNYEEARSFRRDLLELLAIVADALIDIAGLLEDLALHIEQSFEEIEREHKFPLEMEEHSELGSVHFKFYEGGINAK